MDGFEAWKEIVLRYNEQKINDFTTIYDFFFMLDKGISRQKRQIEEEEKIRRARIKGK